MQNPTWVPPGHFYSPIVDPSDPHVRATIEGFETNDLPANSGIELDQQQMIRRLDRLSRFYKDLPFTDQQSAGGPRYFYINGLYEYGDAIVYFGMIRDLKPKRILEIGSGYSSALAMDTNDRFLNRALDLTFVEPYPETLLRVIGDDSFYKEKLIQSKVQDVPTSTFQKLERNDILFIDSSHVAKMASDVNDYLFRILPSLQSGVVIHIHDVLYPFEYWPVWIDEQNRSWNEAYALRAFLQYNHAFRIIYFNDFMFRKHKTLLADKMPLCMRNAGASIWLEKV